MATKKPMKKPVKRVRRFQEGGEAALKAEGLAASNKDAPLGFFESLRRLGQGNIDQEGSEAYNRYGAGRGRMERDAASEAAANRMVDDMNAKRSAKGLASFNQTMESVDAEAGDSARMAEMMQRGVTAGKVLDGADRYRDYTPIAKPAAAAQNAALLAKKATPAASRPAAASSSANATDDLRKYSRRAAVDARAKTPAPAPAAAPAAAAPAARPTSSASAPAASRNDASTTTTQSASESNGSKFDASDALGAGLAVASIIPIVRGGRTLYQAGKKIYQTYKAAKDAIKNRPKLDRPGTVSGEGFVMRDVKDPSAVAKAPQKALPAPRKGDVTDVTAKTAKQMAETNLRERGNKFLFADDAMKRGGAVKKMAHGGSVKSSVSAASKRGDGIALRGKTRGKIY
jgi:hypothetical protein